MARIRRGKQGEIGNHQWICMAVRSNHGPLIELAGRWRSIVPAPSFSWRNSCPSCLCSAPSIRSPIVEPFLSA